MSSDSASELEDRPAKRPKLDNNVQTTEEIEHILPPSYSLLERPPRPSSSINQFGEEDVGITEYISKGLSPIEGIIKQR